MASYNTPELHAQTPPILPPKPGSHDTSGISTPTPTTAPLPPLLHQQHMSMPLGASSSSASESYQPQTWSPRGVLGDSVGSMALAPGASAPAPISDPGEHWLPKMLQDKSKQDLTDILANPGLLSAITHASPCIHPSLRSSHHELQCALAENVELASQLANVEARLSHQRSNAQAQLLSVHALERQWRQKQSDMDLALARFSPAALYQQLSHGVQEQALVCQAMEESFLDSNDVDSGAPASEREAAEWVRSYREAKVQYYLRQERKERWDEGRVGGWR